MPSQRSLGINRCGPDGRTRRDHYDERTAEPEHTRHTSMGAANVLLEGEHGCRAHAEGPKGRLGCRAAYTADAARVARPHLGTAVVELVTQRRWAFWQRPNVAGIDHDIREAKAVAPYRAAYAAERFANEPKGSKENP
jgi:hypothetical protein